MTHDISLSAPTNYEISKTSGNEFTTSLTFAETDGSVVESTVYVRLKAGLNVGNYNDESIDITSTGADAKAVTCSGSVLAAVPTITVSPETLSGLSYVYENGPSGIQSFIVSGVFLTNDISITPPTNYEISLNTGESFSATNPITLPHSSGTINETNVYVRLKAGLDINTYNGEEIVVSSSGATNKTVTCDGAVTSPSPTIEVLLRPTHIDLSSVNSQSAVLMKASYYPSDDAKYRIYNESNQHNCWDSASEQFINSANYSDGPNIPGTPSTSSTWWIIFERGNNNNVNGSYRDRLGSSYGTNYQTQALPASTEIGESFTISGSIEGSNFNLDYKYVVLGFAGETLVSATSTDLITGDYELKAPNGTTITKLEVRSVENEIKFTKEGNWNSNTENETLPVTLSSFTATVNNTHNNVTLNWVTQSESNVLGYYIYRSDDINLENSIRVSNIIYSHNSTLEQTYSFTDQEVSTGIYNYWLMSVDRDGTIEYFGPVNAEIKDFNAENPPVVVMETAFNSIYPNPFNPSTTLSFSLAQSSDVKIKIYNIKGELVREYTEYNKAKGNHKFVWNGKDNNHNNCGTGIYFFKLQAGDYSLTRKALLVK